MKKFKLILFVLAISVFALQSCQNNEPVIPEGPDATESIALRTVLNQLKTDNDISGRMAASRTVTDSISACFDFVYPFQLEYNTGAQVSVESLEGLIQILMGETPNQYIVGIVMPFDLELLDGTIVTINNEEYFIDVLEECDFDVWDDDDVIVDECFEFIYPFEMIDGSSNTVSITSEEDLIDFFANQDPNYYEPIFVYPITVIDSDGNEVVINSIYEFFDLTDDCYDCNCYAVYDPVCVLDPNSNNMIEFENDCYALCEGFTPNDFVDCDGNDDCNIYDLEVSVGDCNADGTYNLTINFEYENPGNDYFDVTLRDFDFFDYFELSELPLTITNFPLSGYDVDSLYVNINDNSICSDKTGWEAPECENEFSFMDYVGECFDFVYPFEVVLNGITYEVNSYTQLTQYFNANTFGVAIIFPLEIVNLATNDTEEIESMEDLENYIEEYCQ